MCRVGMFYDDDNDDDDDDNYDDDDDNDDDDDGCGRTCSPEIAVSSWAAVEGAGGAEWRQ